MKTTNNFLKYTAVVFLVLSVTLLAYAGYCDDRTASYSYNPKGKPDPFRPFVDVTKTDKKLNKSVPLSPLQRISIDQIELVGIIWSDKKRFAIIEDSKGKHHHYTIRKGTRIGMNEGRVVEILTNRVIIVERIKYPSGEIIKERVVLKLRAEENGGKP